MGIASDIVTDFIDPIDKFITSGVTNLANDLEKPLLAGATLYIVIFGIMIVLGYVRTPVQDFVINVLKICIIITLVTQVEHYNTYVKDIFFTHLPEGINSSLGQVPGIKVKAENISNGSAFDAAIDQFYSIGSNIRKSGSWRNLYPIFMSILLGFCAMVVVMILLALVIYAKVALSLVLVVGPIFIVMLLFRVTQSFFSSWLAVAANFVVLQVMVMAMITLMVSIINNQLTSAMDQNVGVQLAVSIRMLGLLALSLYIALQIPEIAARISGGGLALGGGLVSSGVSAAGKIAGKGVGAAGRWGANKARQMLNRKGGSIENRS